MTQSRMDPPLTGARHVAASEGELPLFVDVDQTLLDVQAIVGRKWLPVIVSHLLADEPAHFSTLKGAIDGISAKMLSESLADLQAAGLVTREVVSDKPVRVEYALTDRGRALEGVVVALVRWGIEYGIAEETEEPDAHSAPIA